MLETCPSLQGYLAPFLPIQASSVPCEWLFSSAQKIETDTHTCLGAELFEKIQILKHSWKSNLEDYACMNEENDEL